jgi:hypothetical protein
MKTPPPRFSLCKLSAVSCLVPDDEQAGVMRSIEAYNDVRQSVNEHKQKAWTNHKLESKFRPKSEPVIGPCFLRLLLLVIL